MIEKTATIATRKGHHKLEPEYLEEVVESEPKYHFLKPVIKSTVIVGSNKKRKGCEKKKVGAGREEVGKGEGSEGDGGENEKKSGSYNDGNSEEEDDIYKDYD